MTARNLLVPLVCNWRALECRGEHKRYPVCNYYPDHDVAGDARAASGEDAQVEAEDGDFGEGDGGEKEPFEGIDGFEPVDQFSWVFYQDGGKMSADASVVDHSYIQSQQVGQC